MEMYIVSNTVSLKGLNRKTMTSFWEKKFFNPFREFVALHDSIVIENELKGIGHAVVSASDEGVDILKKNGYVVIPNGTVYAF
jgi:hypothetical protein